MMFQLAKTIEGIKMYGPIYDLGTGWPDKIEEYRTDDLNDWFLNNMVDKINAECATLLDDGDVDYIDAERCKNLVDLIESLPHNFIPIEHKKSMDVLLDYAHRAIEYNTGIEIEM